MKELRIFDTLFAHGKYSTDFQESKYITWNRNSKDKNFAVFTDDSLTFASESNINKKVAWMVESPQIKPTQYKWIKENYNLFDEIWTFKKDLLDISDKFKKVLLGGCWIKPEDQKIYNKSKNISIIASPKKMTKGQSLRHWVIVNYRKNIDVYGREYNPINYKLTGLKDYRFHICIENCKEDYYFSEKLIDCFMTGTIPIYWGCPSIGEIFNTNGMIMFDKWEDLKNILDGLNDELYISKLEAIKENFEIAKNYLITEDYISKNILGI
jgi:hypothetical protein